MQASWEVLYVCKVVVIHRSRSVVTANRELEKRSEGGPTMGYTIDE